MDLNQLADFLSSLFIKYKKEMNPADQGLIKNFQISAKAKGVSLPVVDELVAFYKITNGIPCLDGFDFHACNDETIFEWWDEDRVLWLAQKDFYALTWFQGKYCLGDASNTSFSEEYEFDTLIELIEKAINEWNWHKD